MCEVDAAARAVKHMIGGGNLPLQNTRQAGSVEPVATHVHAIRQRRPDFSTTTFAPLQRVHPSRRTIRRIMRRSRSPRIFHSLFVFPQVEKGDFRSASWALRIRRPPVKHTAFVENVSARQHQFCFPIPSFHANNTIVTPKNFGANDRRIGANDWRSGAYAWGSGLGWLEDWRIGAYARRSGLGRRWRRTRCKGGTGGRKGGIGGRHREAPALGSLHAPWPGLRLLVARVLAVPLPTGWAITDRLFTVPGTFGVQVAVRSDLRE